MPYQDEIPRDLVVGQSYTVEEATNFLYSNPDSMILSENVSTLSDKIKDSVKVIEKYNTYVHTMCSDKTSIRRPTSTTTVYVIQK